MNKYQRNYAMAKARYETARDDYLTYESAYMKERGIERKTPEEIRDKAYDDFWKDEKQIDLDREFHDAMLSLHNAEDDLIQFGLSVIPSGLAEQIKSGLHRLKIRQRFIDITFQLDTRRGKSHIKQGLAELYAANH